MKMVRGINVHGYGAGSDGMQTCAQICIGGLTNAYGEPEEVLKELYKFGYTENVGIGDGACNIVFSISNSQMKCTSRFINYLLNHPNTKIMHAYKNDAHGPNCIYLCIHHKNAPQGFVNNIAEYKAKLRYENCQYYVE